MGRREEIKGNVKKNPSEHKVLAEPVDSEQKGEELSDRERISSPR